MQRLYRQFGTYAAVARDVGRSASSVSKYSHMTIKIPSVFCFTYIYYITKFEIFLDSW